MRYRQVFFEFGGSVIRKIFPPPTPPAPPTSAVAAAPGSAGVPLASLESGQDARAPGDPHSREMRSAPAAQKQAGLRRDPQLEGVASDLLASAGGAGLRVSVFWNHALRTTAGLANWRLLRITLNPRLAGVSADEVRRTLVHELAHLLAQHRAGRRKISAHGPEWKRACADLGIPGEPRCHSLPFERRQLKKQFFYECPVCATVMARVRRQRRKVACLRCCRQFNAGAYSEKFRFREIPPPDPEPATGG